MKIRFLILFVALLAFAIAGHGQPTDTLRLSLAEAVNMAIKQNPQLQSTQLNEDINLYKIKEVKAGALPQVTGNGSFTDNFSRASQLLPGEVFGGTPGTSVPVKFGTRYVMGATANVTQKLFDPSLRLGLKAARESQGLYELQTFKSKEDLIYNVVNVYMQLQMVQQQIELVAGNIDRMEKLLNITKAQYKEGIIKKVDVDQLRVNYTNLTTELSNNSNSYQQLVNSLKTFMNLDVDQPLAITGVGVEPIPVSQQLFIDANTDLNLIDFQMRLQQLNTDNIKAGYKPTLSLNANYGWQGQTDRLLKSGATTGFTSGLYSLQLSIPIFDGFARRNKIAQSNLAYKQLMLNKEYTTKSVKSQYQTARNNLNQNQRVLRAQQENMKVAEELYNVNKLSYTEGIAPLSDLINAENGLKQAQTQYLTAMLQMNIAELDMMQSSGQLSQVIKNTPSTN